MLQPIAASQQVTLKYKPSKEPVFIHLSIEELVIPLITLISKMFGYLPEKSSISVHAAIESAGYSIHIINTGANLSRVSEIYQHIKHAETGITSKGSSFRIYFSTIDSPETTGKDPKEGQTVQIPAYYAQIRKRLTSYFTKSDNLVAVLSNYNKRDALFLKKINDLINKNIDDPKMDANHLSRALNMSRTQLFRKLKPIIRQSPGSYIKTMKLEKAKELFETTDMRINEVAYKTGFESPANFTKAFTRQFGVKPSLFCRSRNGTKE